MKKNHIIKQLYNLLQDAAHLNLKTEQYLEVHIFYFFVGGEGMAITYSQIISVFQNLTEIKFLTKVQFEFNFTA